MHTLVTVLYKSKTVVRFVLYSPSFTFFFRPPGSSSAATTSQSIYMPTPTNMTLPTSTPNNPTITLSLDQLKHLLGLSAQNQTSMFYNNSSHMATSQYLQDQLSELTGPTPIMLENHLTSEQSNNHGVTDQNGAVNFVSNTFNKESNCEKRQHLLNSNVRIDPPQIPSEVLLVGGVPYVRHDQIDKLRCAQSLPDITSNIQVLLQGDTIEEHQTNSSEVGKH